MRGRSFRSFEDAVAHLAGWRDRVANVRVHGTTRRRPVDLFAEERPLLRPLPAESYEICTFGHYRAPRPHGATLRAMNRIAIYCGSSLGRSSEYREAARRLAGTLVERGLGLVYGGGKLGLMGILADSILQHGGEVIGVIPSGLVEKEVAHTGLSELHVVESMHERKARMSDLADGFIALPGGFGTLDEMLEMLTWAQLGLHRKPCGLLNVDGYFSHLQRFVDHAVDEGFVSKKHRDMLILESHPESLVERLAAYRAPKTTKWIDRDQS